MTIETFTLAPQPIEVFFSNGGSAEIGNMLKERGLQRVFVLSTNSDRARALALRRSRPGSPM